MHGPSLQSSSEFFITKHTGLITSFKCNVFFWKRQPAYGFRHISRQKPNPPAIPIRIYPPRFSKPFHRPITADDSHHCEGCWSADDVTMLEMMPEVLFKRPCAWLSIIHRAGLLVNARGVHSRIPIVALTAFTCTSRAKRPDLSWLKGVVSDPAPAIESTMPKESASPKVRKASAVWQQRSL